VVFPESPVVGEAAPARDPALWRFDIREASGEVAPAGLPEQPVPSDGRSNDYQFHVSTTGKLVSGLDADGALVEEYRRLGAVLHHAQLQHGAKSVMISSAVAAEGKTLTATNLALTLSQSYHRRVLLIDADLRRPSVHEVFKLSNRGGLGELLGRPQGGRAQLDPVLPSLWVLTAGRPDPDPMRALVSEAMKQLLHDVTQQFDWVIVDTPPVALLPDANLLAGMIDTALVVVSAATTPYPLVRRASEAIGQSRILGVVLNRATRSAITGGGYYGYGYYGGYGHYAKTKTRSKGRLAALFSKRFNRSR